MVRRWAPGRFLASERMYRSPDRPFRHNKWDRKASTPSSRRLRGGPDQRRASTGGRWISRSQDSDVPVGSEFVGRQSVSAKRNIAN